MALSVNIRRIHPAVLQICLRHLPEYQHLCMVGNHQEDGIENITIFNLTSM